MFFIASKILYFIILPLNWALLLFLFSFFIKNEKKRKVLRYVALGIMLFFSNRVISDQFVKMWEVPYAKADTTTGAYQYGVVLGGMADYNYDQHYILFDRASNRLWQTIYLYKQGYIKKILISGGSGDMLHERKREADILRDYLIDIKIDSTDIIIERDSKNTFENARNVASILKDKSDGRVLLVTSAVHMRRALACFEKQQIPVDAFATDHLENIYYSPNDYIFPNPDALNNWNALIKELVGYCMYKVSGYI